MSQGPPDDLFNQDVNNFPDADPVHTAQLKKQAAELAKQRAAQEKRDRERERDEKKRAKEMQDMPDRSAKEKTVVTKSNKELKMHKIRLYQRYFGERLQVKIPKTLPSSPEAVDELLASIEVELQSSGGIEQAANGYQAAVGGVEQLSHMFDFGLKLSGPAASLSMTVAQNRDKWDELITEFAIANAEWFMMGPGKRIILFTVQMVFAVDSANKAAASGRRVVSEEMEKEAEDL